MDKAFYDIVIKGLQKSAHFENKAALTEKTAHDYALFNQIKTASSALSRLGTGALYGLGGAAGAAIPTALVGNYLSDTVTKDARKRALQTALGIGGIGAGLYGLHRMMQPSPQPIKQASANQDTLLEKLATVGYLDSFFEQQEKVSADANDLRKLNAEHGIAILRQLLNQ